MPYHAMPYHAIPYHTIPIHAMRIPFHKIPYQSETLDALTRLSRCPALHTTALPASSNVTAGNSWMKALRELKEQSVDDDRW